MIVQGLDVSGIARPVLVDANGRVLVTVTDYEPSYFQPVGLVNRTENLNLAAGTNNVYGYTVPANQRMILNNIAVVYIGAVAGVLLRPVVFDGAANQIIQEFRNLVSTQFYGYACDIVMEPGWQTGVVVQGATAGDDVIIVSIMRRIK